MILDTWWNGGITADQDQDSKLTFCFLNQVLKTHKTQNASKCIIIDPSLTSLRSFFLGRPGTESSANPLGPWATTSRLAQKKRHMMTHGHGCWLHPYETPKPKAGQIFHDITRILIRLILLHQDFLHDIFLFLLAFLKASFLVLALPMTSFFFFSCWACCSFFSLRCLKKDSDRSISGGVGVHFGPLIGFGTSGAAAWGSFGFGTSRTTAWAPLMSVGGHTGTGFTSHCLIAAGLTSHCLMSAAAALTSHCLMSTST